MTTKSKGKPNSQPKATGNAPEAYFYVDQLVRCKALNASPDVIRAVLKDGKRYTLAGAKEAINKFLTGKV